MVPLGAPLARRSVTNRPDEALRLTVRSLPVPSPTCSVVVLPGHRTTVAFEAKRPVPALRETVRPIRTAPFRGSVPGAWRSRSQDGTVAAPVAFEFRTQRNAAAPDTRYNPEFPGLLSF